MLLHSRPSLHLLSPGHYITHYLTRSVLPLPSNTTHTATRGYFQNHDSFQKHGFPPSLLLALSSPKGSKLHPPCCFSSIPTCTKGSSASSSTLQALAYAAPSARNTLLASPFLPEPNLPSPPGSPPHSLPLLGYHGPQGFCTSEPVALSVIWHPPPDKCYEGLSLDPPCGLA